MSTKGPYATQAAAGTTQATAAELTAEWVGVTPTVSLAGVVLPEKNRFDEVMVVNVDTTHTLFVYPRTSGAINGATANSALELPPNQGARFRAVDNLNWHATF